MSEADRERVRALLDELDDLQSEVDPQARERIRAAMETAAEVQPSAFGRVIIGFDRSDMAEAFLGAVLFGIPMFVESGTQEVGAYVAARPAFLGFTVAGAVGLVVGLVYVADFQDVRVQNPILGVVPRRLVGVLGVSALTALTAMTAWGRVDWAEPWLALSTIAVAVVPMAIGAALGDIIPGS